MGADSIAIGGEAVSRLGNDVSAEKSQAPLPLILYSGMGADQRMFAAQLAAIPELHVPDWLPPKRNETLRQYARRMAAGLDPRQPCIIGGASFGGFLALEMLPFVNAKACLLVGGVRTPDELPWHLKLVRPLAPLCRLVPFQLFLWAAGFLGFTYGWLMPRRIREFLQLGGSLDANFFAWASQAVLTWGREGPPPATTVPIYHIHGERDRILPIKLTKPTEVVPKGGHIIAVTHPEQVTAFIRRHDSLSPVLRGKG